MTRALAAMLLVLSFGGAAQAEPIAPERIRVIDGDTIAVDGGWPHVRLVGFNAPETTHALCDAERALGDRATRRLRDLVLRGSALDLRFVACSCRPGTEGTMACNYGRRCGTLTTAGTDVGTILVRETLAVPFVCGAERCPRTPRPWCGGE